VAGFRKDCTARPSLDLDPGLLTYLLVAPGSTPVRSPLERQRQHGERRGRRDAMLFQLANLRFTDAGDERHVIVGSTPRILARQINFNIFNDRKSLRLGEEEGTGALIENLNDLKVNGIILDEAQNLAEDG
jgi:hypothetical protein